MAGEITKYKAADGQSVALSVDFVREVVARGKVAPSDRDCLEFIAKCQARGMNPLAGDCFMTVYQNRDGTTSMSLTVSKDYWVRVAHAQPTYRGMRAGIVVVNNGTVVPREGSNLWPGEELLGGWCEVYDSRWQFPQRAEVAFSEYDQGSSLWVDKPATMIRKVAVAQAMREAYPNALQGSYDPSEMGPVEIDDAAEEAAESEVEYEAD